MNRPFIAADLDAATIEMIRGWRKDHRDDEDLARWISRNMNVGIRYARGFVVAAEHGITAT